MCLYTYLVPIVSFLCLNVPFKYLLYLNCAQCTYYVPFVPTMCLLYLKCALCTYYVPMHKITILVVKLCTYNVPSVPNMYLMYLICAWCTCLFLGVHFRYHTLVLENSQSYCSLQVHYRYAIYPPPPPPPPPTLKSHIIRKPAFSTFENSSRLRSVIQKTVSSQQLISTMFYFYHIEPTI